MNTFGIKYRVSIFGESHGELIGVVLDGVPAGLELSEKDLKSKPSEITTVTAKKTCSSANTPPAGVESATGHPPTQINGPTSTPA